MILSVDISTVNEVSIWPGIALCSMTKGIFSLSVDIKKIDLYFLFMTQSVFILLRLTVHGS